MILTKTSTKRNVIENYGLYWPNVLAQKLDFVIMVHIRAPQASSSPHPSSLTILLALPPRHYLLTPICHSSILLHTLPSVPATLLFLLALSPCPSSSTLLLNHQTPQPSPSSHPSSSPILLALPPQLYSSTIDRSRHPHFTLPSCPLF